MRQASTFSRIAGTHGAVVVFTSNNGAAVFFLRLAAHERLRNVERGALLMLR